MRSTTHNIEGEALDAFIGAIPDDAYAFCPCGCGTKWRYVLKEGESTISRHIQQFVAKKMKQYTAPGLDSKERAGVTIDYSVKENAEGKGSGVRNE